ncbi:hypothetical protein [Shimia sp.]|uniref:hypothetical protein n=1 Tax=Shimia sp. TaxID=1954381 RepID=UPI003567B15A
MTPAEMTPAKKNMALALALCLLAPLAEAKPATCRAWTGLEVPYIGDAALGTLGGATEDRAGRPIILLNPERLNAFAPLARDFWLAHECGHHALIPDYNTEAEADCFAMRSLRKKKIRSAAEMQALTEALRALPEGAWDGHAPDAGRIEALAACPAR